jgi:hypothetical protein
MIHYDDYSYFELKDLVAKGIFNEKDITEYYGNEWWDYVEEDELVD